MDLESLRCFLAVVDGGSLAEAARLLELSPNTLSARLHALEQKIGVPLTERSGRAVRPTTAGLNILEKARSIVAQSDEVLAVASGMVPASDFRLGLFPSALPHFMPLLMKRLFAQHPDLSISVTPGYSPDLFGKVVAGEIDAAIVVEHQVGIPKSCAWQVLLEEPLVVVAHNGISPSREAHEILRTEPFLRYDRRVWGGRLAERYLREHGIRPRQRLEIDGLMAIASLVNSRLGVSLLPDWSAMWQGEDNLVRIPLPGDVPVRRIGILWASHGPRAVIARDVMRHASVVIEKTKERLETIEPRRRGE
jgi:DNA-binding transcriptional LysR family regulator